MTSKQLSSLSDYLLTAGLWLACIGLVAWFVVSFACVYTKTGCGSDDWTLVLWVPGALAIIVAMLLDSYLSRRDQ